MKWLLLLASLSFLIILHEFGHFITAKWFKVRVEKFYLFFNPYFSLVKKKIGETIYGIGWLPLGGYVKLAGMIDESMDKSFIGKEPEPYEFRSKPAWQRLIIMLGGIVVNVLIAWIIYALILANHGRPFLKVEDMAYGIEASEIGEKYGLQDGDKLVAFNGKPITEYSSDLFIDVVTRKHSELTVNRYGKEEKVVFDKDFRKDFLEAKKAPFSMAFPASVDSVTAGMPLSKTGIQKGDTVVEIDGKAITSRARALEILNDIQEARPLSVKYNRDGQVMEETVTPIVTTRLTSLRKILGKEPRHISTQIGFMTNQLNHINYSTQEYNFLQAIPAGFKQTINVLNSYIRQFKIIFTKAGIKQIGGLGTFAAQFKGVNWLQFWETTAFISLILAFMNLLPIPALDGGHALFCIFEMITGRKPNEKFLETVQIIGFFLVMALVLYANGLDILRG